MAAAIQALPIQGATILAAPFLKTAHASFGNAGSNHVYTGLRPSSSRVCSTVNVRAAHSSFSLQRHYGATKRIVCTAVAGDNIVDSTSAPSIPDSLQADIGGEQIKERVVVYNEEDAANSGIRLECDESGCVLIIDEQKSNTLEEEKEASSEEFLTCSLMGCFYASTPAEPEFNVLEGTGWRLGYETAPKSEESFCAIVGAGGWSVALTASEFNDFSKLIQMLRKGVLTMGEDGVIGKDEIVFEVEHGSVWMECSVPKKRLPSLQNFWKFGGRNEDAAFDIRFILTGTEDKRQAEGYWPATAVMDMLKKLDELANTASPETSADVPDESVATANATA
eukprot:jgi/Mesen1/5772/ME000292S04846